MPTSEHSHGGAVVCNAEHGSIGIHSEYSPTTAFLRRSALTRTAKTIAHLRTTPKTILSQWSFGRGRQLPASDSIEDARVVGEPHQTCLALCPSVREIPRASTADCTRPQWQCRALSTDRWATTSEETLSSGECTLNMCCSIVTSITAHSQPVIVDSLLANAVLIMRIESHWDRGRHDDQQQGNGWRNLHAHAGGRQFTAHSNRSCKRPAE